MTFATEMDKRSSTPACVLQIDFPSGNRYYSNAGIQTSTQYYKAKVANWGQIRRSVAKQLSLFEVSNYNISLIDVDDEFVKLLDHDSADRFKLVDITIKVGTEDLAFGSWDVIATGKIEDYSINNRMLQLTIKDSFNRLPEYPDTGELNLTDFQYPYIEHLGKPLPVCYGSHSVDSTDETNNKMIYGAWSTLYADIDSYKWIIARHAIKNYDTDIYAVFPDGIQTVDTTAVWNPGDGGAAITVTVTKSNTNNWSGTGTGTYDATTMSYITMSRYPLNSSNQPMTELRINVDGVESVGDGSGTLLTNPIDVLEDIFSNYLDNPSLDAAKFAAIETICINRGYAVAGGYTDKIKTQQMLGDFCASFDMKMYINKDNEIAVHIFTPLITTAGVKEFNETNDITTWGIDFETDIEGNVDETTVINHLDYKYFYHYGIKDFLKGDYADDSAAITKYGETLKSSLEMKWTASANTADEVAARIIFKFRDPVANAKFKTGLRPLQLELTNAIHLTHQYAPNQSGAGYTDRLHEITLMTFDPDDMSVSIEAIDIHYLNRRAFFLGERGTQPADWDDAVGTDDEKYGYLCDRATGEFTNGDEGKHLL